MADLGSLSRFTYSLSALSNLALVRPQNVGYQPQTEDETDVENASFLFTYEGANTGSFESDITDHFVEDNTAIHDHIAIKPDVITVNGYVGELTNTIPESNRFFRSVNDKLTTLDFFAPELSANIRNEINTASRFYALGRRLSNRVVSSLENKPIENNQQKAFNFFYGYWKNRRLFTIQTPWKVFSDMAINKLEITQDDRGPLVSNFDITFKKINFVSSIFSPEEQAKKQTRLKGQTAPKKELKEQLPSVLSRISSSIQESLERISDLNPFIRRPRP